LNLQLGVVRYNDSKTRGVKANDGATIASAVLRYNVFKDIFLGLNVRQMRLDQKGFIPGSGSGVNNAIPSTTDKGFGLENRQWVFDQGAGLNSKKVNYLGLNVEYFF
jgi:hypothetical protein